MYRLHWNYMLSLLLILFFAISCAAHSATRPRVVDLTAADGTHLSATYFAAAKHGPAIPA